MSVFFHRLISTSYKYNSGILVSINHMGVSENIPLGRRTRGLVSSYRYNCLMSEYKSPSSKFQRAVDYGLLELKDAHAKHEDRCHPSQSTSKTLVYHRDILVSCVSQHGQSQSLRCCEMAPTCICPATSDIDGFCVESSSYSIPGIISSERTISDRRPL